MLCFFLKNNNFGLKLKILKFLGIQPKYKISDVLILNFKISFVRKALNFLHGFGRVLGALIISKKWGHVHVHVNLEKIENSSRWMTKFEIWFLISIIPSIKKTFHVRIFLKSKKFQFSGFWKLFRDSEIFRISKRQEFEFFFWV